MLINCRLLDCPFMTTESVSFTQMHLMVWPSKFCTIFYCRYTIFYTLWFSYLTNFCIYFSKLTPALTALSLFNLTYLMFSKSFLCWKVLANPKYFCPWKYFVGAGIGGSLSFYCKMNGCAKKMLQKMQLFKA